MAFACHDPSSDINDSIQGAIPHEAPAPLLANYGAVNEVSYCIDNIVCVLLYF